MFSVDAFGGGLVINALLTIWLSERFGLSVATIGAFCFVTSLCSAVSYSVAVPLARRFGLVNAMVVTHLPSNLFLILTAFAPTIWIAFGLLVLMGLPSQMDVPTHSSYGMANTLTSVLAIAALLAGSAYGWLWLDPLMGIVGAWVIAR